ncbi:MAG: septation ring formation regulator EzrA [Mycobacterium sp.]|nr:MAG: septation ring formation regulator EzrA [Mycobacterium sp.]
MSSDFQCRLLLESLETRYAADKLGDELRTAVDQLATTVHRQQALADDPAYRQAVEDVQRLRQHLAFDAERSDAREAEIVNLRSELRRKNGEIEDLHEALARARTEGDRSPQLASQALSRQQRRAVERASRKSQL